MRRIEDYFLHIDSQPSDNIMIFTSSNLSKSQELQPRFHIAQVMGSLHLHIQLGLVRLGLVRLAHKGTLDLGISFIGKMVNLKRYKLQQRVVFGACNAGIKEKLSAGSGHKIQPLGCACSCETVQIHPCAESKMFWLPSVIDPQMGADWPYETIAHA